MKAYVCDRCGVVATNKTLMEKITRIDFSTDRSGKYSECHLCEGCAQDAYDFVHGADVQKEASK